MLLPFNRCIRDQLVASSPLKSGPVSAPDSPRPPPGKPRKTPGFGGAGKSSYNGPDLKNT